MSASAAAPPLDALDASLYDEWKHGPGKNFSIVRSSSAVVSVAASALLIWILLRSRGGLKTPYHRLLLGVSVSDILFSLSWATFNAAVPRELNYAVWNARGGRASCDALGFVQALGWLGGLLYMCSLNLYYLAKVRFNKTDAYIAKKLEPWLHLVPTSFGSIVSVASLVKRGMNASITGVCDAMYTYEPPHCDGYDDGDVPEGFDIPCGRGRGVGPISIVGVFVTVILVPVTIGGSLWTIYRTVRRAEQRIARYGVGSLRISRTQPTTGDASATDVDGGDGGGGGGGAFSVLTAVGRRFRGRASATSSDNQDSSQSRAVLQKAAAYSFAYFATWIWTFVVGVLGLAGTWTTDLPQPEWQIAYRYAWYFFQPLQGLWTLLIYVQPNVVKRKRSSGGDASWLGAFAGALRSAVAGPVDSADGSGRDRAGRRAPRTVAAPGRAGTNPTPAPGPKGRNTSATAESIDRRGSAEAVGLEAEDPEEEKRDVREDDPSV